MTYRPNKKCARALIPDCGFTISGTEMDSNIHSESEILLQVTLIDCVQIGVTLLDGSPACYCH